MHALLWRVLRLFRHAGRGQVSPKAMIKRFMIFSKHANQHHKYLRPGAPFTSRMDVTQLEAALDEFKASFVVYMDKELQKPKPKPKRPLNNPFASTRTRRIQRPNKVIAKRSTTMVKTKTTAATASFDSQLGLWFCNLCPFNSPKKWPMNRVSV